MSSFKLALARVNYSQLYGVYDKGKTYSKRDILAPYHLISLAAWIRDKGYEVRIFDAEVDLISGEQLAEEIIEWNPDFIGFTSTTPDIDIDIDVLNIIKLTLPDVVTIIGGPHASAMPEDVASHDCIDYVVVGDGEEALERILDKKPSNGKIVFGQFQDVTKLPMPAHDLLDYSKYQFANPVCGQLDTASIMSSRGCPFSCTFCFHNKHIRFRNIDDFVDEIVYLYENKNIRYFYIYDDTFLIQRERALEILRRIQTLKLSNTHFQCLTRANLLDEYIVEVLRDTGFVRVSMGIESGCDEILKTIKKGVKKDDYVVACNILYDFNIETRGSFIIGSPYETVDTIKQTIEFSKQLNLFHANFNIMTPYPGTIIYDDTMRGDGLYFDKPEYAYKWQAYRRWGKSIIRTDTLSSSDIEYYQKQAQTEFYTQSKVADYYKRLFLCGNTSKYFYRPLNFAWNNKCGHNISFWDNLEESEIVDPIGRKTQ